MIREKFDRIGRANIMRVSAPRVGSSAEAFGLLRSEIVEVKGRILKLTFEPRSVRIPECG
jgi:hypothetical protein